MQLKNLTLCALCAPFVLGSSSLLADGPILLQPAKPMPSEHWPPATRHWSRRCVMRQRDSRISTLLSRKAGCRARLASVVRIPVRWACISCSPPASVTEY